MNLTISGHNIEVTPALRDYALRKITGVTSAFNQVVDVKVLLRVERRKGKRPSMHEAQATVRVAGQQGESADVRSTPGQQLHIKHGGEDLYASIDLLCDKLRRQVGSDKTKTKHHRAHPMRRLVADAQMH